MICCACGSEMKYKEYAGTSWRAIGLYNRESDAFKGYECKCGADCDNFGSWYIPKEQKPTAKQIWAVDQIGNTLNQLAFKLRNDDEWKVKLIGAIHHERYNLITKRQASSFIKKYKDMKTVEDIMNLQLETKTVKVYNGIVISGL